MLTITAALSAVLLATGAQGDSIPLFDDLGDHRYGISTASPVAQQYFDQGLRLVYAFNHADAIRSFRVAQRLDPSCAMCFWGEALAFGPNINVLMDSASGAAAYKAVRRAVELSPRASAKERALIQALATRYGADPTADRKSRDSAYARAASDVARRFPNDDDAAVFAAEAQMLLGAWDYWTAEKRSKPHGAATLALLEPVVKRSPNHAGACHFYIHAVEAAFPERAVPCADRLPTLMPGAGHVVHMPGHIYIRVGRYADAIERNVHALHADEERIQDMAPDGVYRLGLHPHNGHFLSFAATMIGRSAQALEAAQLTRSKVDTVMMRQPGLGALQHYYMLPTLTRVRFAKWDEVLAEPEVAKDLPYPAAVRHYARALAFTARRDLSAAERELAELRKLRADPRVATVTIWDLNPVTTLLDIAAEAVSAEVAVARGQVDVAIRHLQKGIELEDGLTYDEPPVWHLPVRQQLGVVLLAAGRAVEAEKAYREDLDRHPENGWSLYGLASALEAQGKTQEAAQVRQRFEKVWSGADVKVAADAPAAAVKVTAASAGHEHGGTNLQSVQLANGIKLSYAEDGDPSAPPVVLLHGWSDSWFSFSPVLSELAKVAHVYSVSMRGHGESDGPATGYTMPQLAADVVAFMDALGLERTAVIGHSLGSLVAEHVAASVPDRVTRLVLVGGIYDPRDETMKEMQQQLNGFTDEVPRDYIRDFQLATLHNRVPDEFLATVIEESRKHPLHAWQGVAAAMNSDEAPASLSRITAATLLIWGDQDAFFKRDQQDKLVASIKGAKLVVYEDTGHAVHWERPERFGKEVAEFLTETRSATR
jgi:pimeloyl-ACP methyl ester carboxylesterase/tetratricopeptide (TPR) repeat protein